MNRFDVIRERIMGELAKACPQIHVDTAFEVALEEGSETLPARLVIRPQLGVAEGLRDYLANQAAAAIETLKDVGAKNGFYTPQNDGRFYLAGDLNMLDAIVNKQRANAEFVQRLQAPQPMEGRHA